MTRRPLFECPHCGADVPVGRPACPECGSDAETGWQDQEQIDYQGVELPQGYAVDADHPGGVVAPRRLSPVMIAVALVTAVAFGLWAILG